MAKAIYFDMDGTIADLYAVEGWLEKLRAYDVSPYVEAHTLVNMNALARVLNKLKGAGYYIGIVSWLSKEPSPDYDKRVESAKRAWLAKHLKSVKFDEIAIVAHGTPKSSAVKVNGGILFDDEPQNRTAWQGTAYDEKNILGILKNLAKNA